MAPRRYQVVIAIMLVAIAILSRLMPHPANFTALTAVAIFGGAILPKRLAIILPVVAMIVSDIFLGFHSLIFFTWGTFVLIAAGSYFWLRDHQSFSSLAASAFLGSLLFYIITNFAVWAQGILYPMTYDGLVKAYLAGIPFFRNMLIGDLFFSLSIFGMYWLASNIIKLQQNKPAQL